MHGAKLRTMNHIPKFLIPQKKRMSSNRGPKLERRFALRKDIDYEPPPSDTDTCQSLRTRSLDIPNNNINNNATSFRIHGVEDGEVDLVFRSLGLSPDDFAIPIASWEAHKARSASDLFPRRERDGETRRERERDVETRSEREGEMLGERRFSEETATNNCKTRSNLDISSSDMCREREREALGERRFSEKTATNNTGSILDNSDYTYRERLGEKWRETHLSNDDSVVNSDETCCERERETLGEKRGFELSNKFQDSVRVSDEIATDNDGFMVMDPFDADNTRSILNISSEDMYDDRYTNGDRCGIKGVRTNLMAPPVSPMVVNDRSSMFDIISNDLNTSRYAIVESTDNCSTSRSEIKRLSIDNTSSNSNWDLTSDFNNVGANATRFANIGSIGGIKGVRPPLLAPPPSISAKVIDNTSSTWDIMRSFAPDSEENPSPVRERSSYYDDEEEREARPRGNAAFSSESCSFTTTSNDDDSSSTTTEPMSNISPNGRFKRVITYWEKGELLGRGSFGTVYEGIADGGYFIAVKEVSLLDQGDMGRQSVYQLEQEIALLSQFEHENIVQYYGTDKDEANLYIFLELVTKGSLLNLYQKYHLRDSQVSSYTRQILHGLKYLHERNVVHRDIKCANILVGADGSVKLADFGLAKATKLNDVKSCKGTAFWMAPEVVRGRHQGYGLPADIWSLGCTVLEMLTHRIPYSPLECYAALFRIGRGEPPPIPDSLSRDARDFISRCLKVDPTDRPTATQLLEHSFVRRPLSTSSGSSSPYHHSVGRGLNLSSR